MKCLIMRNAEIEEDECDLIVAECYKEKNSKDLPKHVKRVIGWKSICRECENHTKVEQVKSKSTRLVNEENKWR